MTADPKTLLSTAVQRIPASSDLRHAPRHRQEAKVKSSFLGIIAAVFGLGVMAFAGFLLIGVQPTPDWKIVAGVAGVGFVMFSFGCLMADRETVLPALTTLITLGKEVRGKS